MTGRIRPCSSGLAGRTLAAAGFVRAAATPGGSAYELLIGLDPSRTPRLINRWGFIAEE